MVRGPRWAYSWRPWRIVKAWKPPWPGSDRRPRNGPPQACGERLALLPTWAASYVSAFAPCWLGGHCPRLAADALPNARASDIVEHLARRWGLRRKVAVLVHEQVSIPFTYGFLNPRIMLPAASRLVPRQMSPVLAHEVAHVKRGDSLVGAVAHAVCSILWFVPPLWVSRLLMRQEAERSCDVFVLSQGVPKREYASMLIKFAAQRRGVSFLAAHALLGRRSSIERRIRNILDWTHASCTGGDRFRAAAVVVPCLLVVLTAIGLAVVQRNGLFGTWAGIGQHGSARYTWSDDGIGKRYATGYVSSGVGSVQVPEEPDGGSGAIRHPGKLDRFEWRYVVQDEDLVEVPSRPAVCAHSAGCLR